MKNTVWLDEKEKLLMYIDRTLLPSDDNIRSCDGVFEFCEVIKRGALVGERVIAAAGAIALYASAMRIEDTLALGYFISFI